MATEDDDHLYERPDQDWVARGRPCPKCGTPMQYDAEVSNKVTRTLFGDSHGTKEPVFSVYACVKCGNKK